MKKNSFFILNVIIIAVSIVTSCKTDTDSQMMNRIHEIWQHGETAPTEAIRAYREITPRDIEACSRYTQIKHQLLGVRLRYKADIKPVSADSIISVCSYMDDYGTPDDQVTAYYYMAAVYVDLHNYPKALESCLKAVEILDHNPPRDKETADIDTNLYSLTAYLYRVQLMHEDALQYALKEYETAKAWGILDPVHLADIGAAYENIHKPQKAAPYYRLLVDKVVKDGTMRKFAASLACALTYFSSEGDRHNADRVAAILKALPQDERPYNYYIAVAYYADLSQNIDSIVVAMSDVLKYSNLSHDRRLAAGTLAKVYTQRGDKDKAIKYSILFGQITDSVYVERQHEATAVALTNEHYRQAKEREIQMLKENDILRNSLFVSVLAVSLLGIFGAVFYVRKRSKMWRKYSQQEQIIESVQDTITERSNKLAEVERLLEVANAKLASSENELVQLEKALEQKERIIAAKTRQNKEIKRALLDTREEYEGDDVVFRFERAAQKEYEVTDKDWVELFQHVDEESPGFFSTIEHAGLTSNTMLLRTCYLMKLGMTNSQISIITASPRQSVSSRVLRIKRVLEA